MIRVVLVDDQQLVRSGIRALLDRADDITVVAEADDGETGIDATLAERPDVVLMDIRMPGLDGLAATERILSDPRLKSVKVVVLTTFDTDDHIFTAIRLGASGFLLKDSHPDDLRAAVRKVASGDALLDPAVTQRVMDAAASNPTVVGPERLDTLTAREREVLTEVAAGRSNQEIGNRLHMSPATARTHVGRILTKLDARDRAQLVRIAYDTGLVSPGADR